MTKLIDPVNSAGMRGAMKQAVEEHKSMARGTISGIKIPDPHALMTTLAVMKKAKEQGVNMCIWDRDIKAVEDAIAAFDAIRALSSPLSSNNSQGEN